MEFAPKAGCPMCGIVSSALHDPLASPRSPLSPLGSASQPEILWKDDNFTVFREKLHPVSSKGHIIVALNLHVPSIYCLSSTDVPLLVSLKNLATRHLHALLPPAATPTAAIHLQVAQDSRFRIGFITPPFRDNKIPITDHLHAHAYIDPSDLAGWWRGIAYGPLAWYAIEDLIAEIRESESNNRVKTGYRNRQNAPIDTVPSAGARMGTADGLETTAPGLARADAELEAGDVSPMPSATVPSTDDRIPTIRV